MADFKGAAEQRVQRGFATPYRPVEKGVSGKEKTFQQNRNFGPGAFVPYPGSPSTRGNAPRPIPNARVERQSTRA